MKDIQKRIKTYSNELIFLIAGTATMGSLILSQVSGFIPCELCWYQRIAMFPLAVIAGVAVLRNDKLAYLYVLPLSIVGGAIALYQSILQWGLISFDITECSLTAVSCAEPEIKWLGFLTIPFGALLAFTAITSVALLGRRTKSDLKGKDMFWKTLSVIFAVSALGAITAKLFI